MYIEIKWGVVISLAGLIWVILEFLSGLHSTYIQYHPYVSMLWIPFSITLLVFALREKKHKYYNGIMSYTEGFKTGAVIALIILVLSPIIQWFFHSFINPDFFTNAIDFSVKRAMGLGMDLDIAKKTYTEYFNLKSYIIQSTMGGFFGTLITTAIAMIFLRTKNGGQTDVSAED